MARMEMPVYIRVGNRPEALIGTVTGKKLQIGAAAWKAQALREAANDLYGDNGPDHPLSTMTWLLDRADRIEQGAVETDA